MSGTFEEIDVPPTLVSFAVSVTDADKVVSQEFKKAGSKVILIKPEYDDNKLVNFDSLKAVFKKVEKLIAEGKVLSCWAVSYGGVSEAVAKMAFGNKIGFKFTDKLTAEELYRACYGAFVIELAEGVDTDERVIGETTESYEIKSDNYTISLDKLQTLWEGKLEPVYPVHVKEPAEKPEKYSYKADKRVAPAIKVAKPKVLIPVFPGTNCEYDTARAFEKAGAEADIFVVRNLTEQAIKESVDAMEKKIKESQIVMLPGGFSGGDEPDGSGKFIVSFLRNPRLTDAIHDLLKNRDGLMLGICNGFQALIKLGLVPYGEIRDMRDDSPTLTFNTIARHQSKMVNTRIASNKSPWLAGCEVGDIHSVAISHGEGRFVATAEDAPPERPDRRLLENLHLRAQLHLPGTRVQLPHGAGRCAQTQGDLLHPRRGLPCRRNETRSDRPDRRRDADHRHRDAGSHLRKDRQQHRGDQGPGRQGYHRDRQGRRAGTQELRLLYRSARRGGVPDADRGIGAVAVAGVSYRCQ